jgi:hypothetical protein
MTEKDEIERINNMLSVILVSPFSTECPGQCLWSVVENPPSSDY